MIVVVDEGFAPHRSAGQHPLNRKALRADTAKRARGGAAWREAEISAAKRSAKGVYLGG